MLKKRKEKQKEKEKKGKISPIHRAKKVDIYGHILRNAHVG